MALRLIKISARGESKRKIDAKRSLCSGERGIEPFESTNEDTDRVRVAESGEPMTTPPVQVHIAEEQERQGRVDRIGRQ